MSKRLSFNTKNGRLVIKFDGQPIPEEKLEGIFEILTADVERSARSLQKLYDKTHPSNQDLQIIPKSPK